MYVHIIKFVTVYKLFHECIVHLACVEQLYMNFSITVDSHCHTMHRQQLLIMSTGAESRGTIWAGNREAKWVEEGCTVEWEVCFPRQLTRSLG